MSISSSAERPGWPGPEGGHEGRLGLAAPLTVTLLACLLAWTPAARAATGVAAAAAAAPASAPRAAAPVDWAERAAVLDAIRPAAARRVRQPVRIKVERLNLAGGWALLTGELVSPAGQRLAWARAPGCHPELDKGLWAVLSKGPGGWRLRHLEVCATEPPHWDLSGYGGLRWPCGVYAGLTGPEGQDLQQACLAQPGQAGVTAPRSR